MTADWEFRGCILLFMAAGVCLIVLLLLLPWWIPASAFGVLVLAGVWHDRRHPSVARRIRRHRRSWDPDVEWIALVRVARRPHGSTEEVELIVRSQGAVATWMRRPRHDCAATDVQRAEVAVPAETVAGLRRTLEALSAWERPDQRSDARDGTWAEVGLAEASRSHAFTAHMPRGAHRALIEKLLALVSSGAARGGS